MAQFLAGLAIGLIVGACGGVFVMAALVSSARSDRPG
jgi:hypothetical protein